MKEYNPIVPIFYATRFSEALMEATKDRKIDIEIFNKSSSHQFRKPQSSRGANMKGKTHYEDRKYYAVIVLKCGHEYYSGPFNSRSAAYRRSVSETAKHRFASSNGMIYNTRSMP